MSMRVTPGMVSATSLANLQKAYAASAKAQDRLSSGKAIQVPSDSPTGTAQALLARTEISATTQYQRNADDGADLLGRIDSTMGAMFTAVQQIRSLTVQGLNGGAMTPEGRQAIAVQVSTLRDQLLADANQTYQGRPLFGGTTGEPKAYDADGTFLGTQTPVTRRVGPTTVVRVDISGPEAFGPAGNDLFAVAARIATDVTDNPTSLGADLDALDGVLSTMQRAVADVGARENRVSQAKDAADTRLVSLQGQLSGVEDVDLVQATMDQQTKALAYQAALGATAKIIQTSLLDFLR